MNIHLIQSVENYLFQQHYEIINYVLNLLNNSRVTVFLYLTPMHTVYIQLSCFCCGMILFNVGVIYKLRKNDLTNTFIKKKNRK